MAIPGFTDVIGQDYSTCVALAGTGSAAFNGQWICYDQWVIYKDGLLPNCFSLNNTVNATNPQGQNAPECPVCINPSQTCNNLGTDMVLFKISGTNTRYPHYAPDDLPLVYREDNSISGGTGIAAKMVMNGAYYKLILDRSYCPFIYELHWSWNT